jgi:hypothetical protein
MLITFPSKRNMRSKYGHALINTDLCARIVPLSQTMAKSAVASSGCTHGAASVLGRFLGGFGADGSDPGGGFEGCKGSLGVAGSKLSALSFLELTIGRW